MSVSISIKVTVPKEILNSADIRRSLGDMQRRKTGPEIKALFRQTTEGWRHKPTWNQHFVQNSQKVSVTVQTGTSESAETYALVNAGARPHAIYPRVAGGWLRFRQGYTAGTAPRSLVSRAYKRWGRYVARQSVNHPGFEAREFDKAIVEQYTDTFEEDMQRAISDSAQRAMSQAASQAQNA